MGTTAIDSGASLDIGYIAVNGYDAVVNFRSTDLTVHGAMRLGPGAAFVQPGSNPLAIYGTLDINGTFGFFGGITPTFTTSSGGSGELSGLFLDTGSAVHIGNGPNPGVLNANGNVYIQGGVLSRTSNSSFNWAAGKTMTITTGGQANFAQNYATAANATYNMTGGTLRTTSGWMGINDGAQVFVSKGGVFDGMVSASSWMDVGTSGSGSLRVLSDHAQATAVAPSHWGFNGGTATVAFDNAGVGTFGDLSLGEANGHANVTVSNGGILNGQHLALTPRTNFVQFATDSATVNVQDSLSTVNLSGALDVGNHNNGTSAAINVGTVSSGATFNTGTALTTINANGVINVGAGAHTGTFRANGNVLIDGGQIVRGAGSALTLATGKTLTVQNGGLARFNGGYFTATGAHYVVTGGGSRLETPGGGATLRIEGGATVSLANGGELSSAYRTVIGNEFGDGTLAVDGAGSQANVNFVGIHNLWGVGGHSANVQFSNGASGAFPGGIAMGGDAVSGSNATLDVTSGATVSVGNLSLVQTVGAATASVFVNGPGSALTQTPGNVLTVGNATLGLLVANAGINVGTVGSGAVFNSSTGQTTVNRTGRIDIGSQLFGGPYTGTFNANGDVLIDGGVLVSNAGSVFNLAAGKTMAVQAGGGAFFNSNYETPSNAVYFIRGTGSTLGILGMNIRDSSQVIVSLGGLLSTGAGTIDVNTNGRVNLSSGGTVVAGNGFNVQSAGALSGNGTVTANMTNGGAVSPDGLLDISGNFGQTSGGLLSIAIGGHSRGLSIGFGGYDVLSISGAATLGGTLSVTLANGFSPAAGDVFDILDWSGSSGAFAAVNLPTLGSGLIWDRSNLYGSGVLQIVAPDFNGDGRVDGADLSLWDAGFGTTSGATRAQGDANGDGAVDGADFLAWQRQLGSPAPAVSANAPVPEPATSLLVIVAAVGIRWVGGRRRQQLIDARRSDSRPHRPVGDVAANCLPDV